MNEDAPRGSGLPDEEARRIWWRSRRGLREIDLLLLPFVEDVFPSLGARERAVYLRLIDREDSDLVALLTRREAPDDAELEAMIERILGSRRAYS